MEDLPAVQVVQPQGHLHEDVPRLGLRHAAAVLAAELVQDALEVPPVFFGLMAVIVVCVVMDEFVGWELRGRRRRKK